MANETNPFRLYPMVTGGPLIPPNAAQTAKGWLLGSAVADISTALAGYLEEYKACGLRVRVHQRGEQYVATGVDLPVLERRINEVMATRGVAPFDRVGYCLGLSLKEPSRSISIPLEDEPEYGDFELGEDRARGMYVGVRIQRSRPNGTVPQDVHDLVFGECERALKRTGQADWKQRRNGYFWSVWRFVGPSSHVSASDAKATYLELLLHGVAALEGVGWERP